MATHTINVTGTLDPASKSTGGNESADAGKLLEFNTEGQIQGSSNSSSLAAVKGSASGSSYGVHGDSVNGTGVVGQSVNGNGIDAASNNNKALSAINFDATDPVIAVKNANVANTAPLAIFHRNNNQGLTIKNDGSLEWDSATGAEETRDNLGLGSAAVEDAATTSTADAVVKALATGKIDTSFLPDSVLGQLEYQGAWNAATNTPAIPAASSSNLGWYYIASASVAVGHGYANVPNVAFDTGDWIVSNGTTWDKIDNTDAVASVFGRVGVIVAANGDYNAGQVTNTPSGNIAATTVQAAINELDTEKQPVDSDLTAIAAISPANDDIIQRKAGSWVNRTVAQLWADLKSLADLVYAQKSISIRTYTGTTDTLVLADAGNMVRGNNAGANTCTIPPNASVAFPTGTQILFVQRGAGQMTIAAGGGVTVNSFGSALKLVGQYAQAMVTKVGTDEWSIDGNLTT